MKPVEGLYTYGEAAIDRIIEITSGHAYFMQLLCHSLFSGWQSNNKPEITVEDVNGVASEVVERGAANLKFDWDESLPVEKLFLSAMAEAMVNDTPSVTLGDVDEVLQRYEILVPQGELIGAQRSLIGKELASGTETMGFAIDFLRLWVRQHQRLEWVKEELSTEIQELREIAEAEQEAAERLKMLRRFRWGSLVGGVASIVLLLLFVPGSPVRVFSASVAEEMVSVVQTLDFSDDSKCGFQTATAGAILAMCLETVEKLSDKTTKFYVNWTASIDPDARFDAVNRQKTELGAPVFLQDESGNEYRFTDMGAAAALPFAVEHSQTSESGWFHFPPLPDGVKTVILVDETGEGGRTLISDIALE